MSTRDVTCEPDLAGVAALIGDRSRAAILRALADGRALPAGELAHAARISAPTASAHLDKLFKGNLLAVEVQGRHHYYRLRDARVAEMLELLSSLAPAPPLVSSRVLRVPAMVFARTCYGHLGGKLGVAVSNALCSRGYLARGDNGFELTATGHRWFTTLQIDAAGLKRRPLAPWHIDWSERRHHLAGALGAALTSRMFELNWIERIAEGRALHVTDRGRKAFKSTLLLEL
jgi:DNA-binding transcriptional ArsR family regulator